MIVCHCRVVSDRDIDSAIRDGARSLAAICRRTGAGQDCGTCIFSVKQLLCQHEESAAAVALAAAPGVVEVDRAAS